MNKKQLQACSRFRNKLERIWKEMSKTGRKNIILSFQQNIFDQSRTDSCFLGLGLPRKAKTDWKNYIEYDKRFIKKEDRIYFEVFQATDLRNVFRTSDIAFWVADSIIHEFVARKWYNSIRNDDK